MKVVVAMVLALSSVTVAAAEPVVKLLDAGKGPKVALRNASKTGHRETLVLTMGSTSAGVADGKAMPSVPTPVIRVPIDFEIQGASANGDVRCSFKLQKPTDSAGAPGFEKLVSALEGATGTWSASPRGIVHAGEPSADQGLLAGVKQSFAELGAVYPEEALGVGARWQVTTSETLGGVAMRRVASYEVTAISGAAVTVKETSTFDATPDQTVSIAGATVTVKAMAGTKTGELVVDGAHVLPAPASIAIKLTTDAVTGGKRMQMTTDTHVSLKVK